MTKNILGYAYHHKLLRIKKAFKKVLATKWPNILWTFGPKPNFFSIRKYVLYSSAYSLCTAFIHEKVIVEIRFFTTRYLSTYLFFRKVVVFLLFNYAGKRKVGGWTCFHRGKIECHNVCQKFEKRYWMFGYCRFCKFPSSTWLHIKKSQLLRDHSCVHLIQWTP